MRSKVDKEHFVWSESLGVDFIKSSDVVDDVVAKNACENRANNSVVARLECVFDEKNRFVDDGRCVDLCGTASVSNNNFPIPFVGVVNVVRSLGLEKRDVLFERSIRLIEMNEEHFVWFVVVSVDLIDLLDEADDVLLELAVKASLDLVGIARCHGVFDEENSRHVEVV